MTPHLDYGVYKNWKIKIPDFFPFLFRKPLQYIQGSFEKFWVSLRDSATTFDSSSSFHYFILRKTTEQVWTCSEYTTDFITIFFSNMYVKVEPQIRQFFENRWIPNIRQRSQMFSHKLTSNCENWLSHIVFANIHLFGKFGKAENVFGT